MLASTQSLGFGSASGYGASQESPAIVAQTQSPEKRARQEDKQTCLPATIRLLQDAHQSQKDSGADEMRVNGVEIVNVALVGIVEKLSRQAAVLEFTLNDGSGRLKVRHYQSSNAVTDPERDGVADGRYVCVVGGLRSAPALHISAVALRPVSTGDEVSFHMIEVAHTALLMKRSQPLPTPARAPAALPPPSQTSQTESLGAPDVAAPTEGSTAPAPGAVLETSLPGLSAAVLQVLGREGESKPEGVPLAIMVDCLKPAAVGDVRAVLEELVANGEAYTTIDEEHFLPL